MWNADEHCVKGGVLSAVGSEQGNNPAWDCFEISPTVLNDAAFLVGPFGITTQLYECF